MKTIKTLIKKVVRKLFKYPTNIDNSLSTEECQKFYGDYKKELETLFGKSNEMFETQLSYISAGALGITFILIEKVIKDLSKSECKWMLITSWILLTLTLSINLFSHIVTSKLHSHSIREINEGVFVSELGEYRNRIIIFFNFLSVLTLFVGILLFVIFTSKNVISMNNGIPAANTDTIEKGLPSTPAPLTPNPTSSPSSTSTPSPTPLPTKQ